MALKSMCADVFASAVAYMCAGITFKSSGEEEGGVEMRRKGAVEERDEVRKRKVGARLSPSEPPPPSRGSFHLLPAVAAQKGGRALMWQVGAGHLLKGRGSIPTYAHLLPLLGVGGGGGRGSIAEFI